MVRRRGGSGSGGGPPPALGPRVRALREAASKSPAEAAEAAGMTEEEWLAVEEGRRSPTLGVMLGMAQALGCTAGELLGGHRPISSHAEQAAVLFEQCPEDVQESVLKLLRRVTSGQGNK